jgi:DNA polymerase III epsilon subunit-like protein
MREIMLDLETLSTRPNAIILSIGAIKFERKGPIRELNELDQFYKRIDIQSCRELGLHYEESVNDWWSRQDQNIRYEALENPDRSCLKDVLHEFKDWFRGCKLIWANGDDFDCVILAEAYKAAGIDVPWNYWDTRDVRTALDIGKISQRDLPANDKHHPVHDCYRQIIGVKKVFSN